MWYEALELYTTRRLQQDNGVALQPGLKPRPEVFDIRCSDHSLMLILLLQRWRELTNTGDDVGSGCQRETSDIGMALRRSRTELPHRSKDDYPLPSATGSLE